jgi:hypothetical protein
MLIWNYSNIAITVAIVIVIVIAIAIANINTIEHQQRIPMVPCQAPTDSSVKTTWMRNDANINTSANAACH